MKKIGLVLLLTSMVFSQALEKRSAQYFDDDRQNLHECTIENVQDLAKSVCLITWASNIKTGSDGRLLLRVHGTHEQALIDQYSSVDIQIGCFKNVPFLEEPVVYGKYASGFLVSQNQILTAQHVVRSNGLGTEPFLAMSSLVLVFGFSQQTEEYTFEIIEEEGKKWTKLPVNSFYRMANSVSNYGQGYTTYNSHTRRPTDAETGGDWAIVSLTQSVPIGSAAAISISRSRDRQYHVSELFAIGYPEGLPMKISPKGDIRSDYGYLFQGDAGDLLKTTIDAWKGNSGSPVFALPNHCDKAIGIVCQGENTEYAADPDDPTCLIEGMLQMATLSPIRYGLPESDGGNGVGYGEVLRLTPSLSNLIPELSYENSWDECAPPLPQSCGDGICDENEHRGGESECQADCPNNGPWPNDGQCEDSELCGGNYHDPTCEECDNDPVCGDGNCESTKGETCYNCASDCGVCQEDKWCDTHDCPPGMNGCSNALEMCTECDADADCGAGFLCDKSGNFEDWHCAKALQCNYTYALNIDLLTYKPIGYLVDWGNGNPVEEHLVADGSALYLRHTYNVMHLPGTGSSYRIRVYDKFAPNGAALFDKTINVDCSRPKPSEDPKGASYSNCNNMTVSIKGSSHTASERYFFIYWDYDGDPTKNEGKSPSQFEGKTISHTYAEAGVYRIRVKYTYRHNWFWRKSSWIYDKKHFVGCEKNSSDITPIINLLLLD